MNKFFTLVLTLVLSATCFSQSSDLYYGTSTNKDSRVEKSVNTKSNSGKVSTNDFQIGIGATLVNGGTLAFKTNGFYSFPDNNFDVRSNGVGILLNWGINFHLKNQYYFTYKMQYQSEKSSATIYGLEANFFGYNFMHCFGIEKRFNRFVLGLDIPICISAATVSADNISEDIFATSFFSGLDLNLAYQFKSGIRLGCIERFSGTNYTFAESIEKSSYQTSSSSIYMAYIFNGKKKSKINNSLIVQPNAPLPSREPVVNREPALNTESLTDEQLELLMKNALQKENYQLAEQYQKEIDKRKISKQYADKTLPELNKLMNDAIKAEDYKKAEEIQKVIDKNGGIKKSENTNSQPAHKSLKDLEDDLKKAMDAEDYKKAEDIQKQINLIKKP